MHALTLIIIALPVFALAYRFYAKFIITHVPVFDVLRPTAAYWLRDGRDYHPTHRYVLFGHPFAATAGAGRRRAGEKNLTASRSEHARAGEPGNRRNDGNGLC
jgi:hypothetical protein